MIKYFSNLVCILLKHISLSIIGENREDITLIFFEILLFLASMCKNGFSTGAVNASTCLNMI